MATPLGHALLGISFLRVVRKPVAVTTWKWYLLGLISANAADLDFIPGIIIGNPNQFHHGPSHSLLAAIFFGILASAFAKWLNTGRVQIILVASFVYSSHLLLDYFASDSRAPFGMPLLWPFSDKHWLASVALFPGIKHGVPGESFLQVLVQIFSMHNAYAIFTEIIILLPVLLATRFLKHVSWK